MKSNSARVMRLGGKMHKHARRLPNHHQVTECGSERFSKGILNMDLDQVWFVR